MKLQDVASRIEKIDAIDKIGDSLGGVVKKLIPAGQLKDALSGTWLGHPLHPLLTDIPIGSFTSATLLDLVGGRRSQPAANFLAAVGVMATLPTAAAGLADWSDTYGAPWPRSASCTPRRTRWASGSTRASILARTRGNRFSATTLGVMGMGAMSLGGYLGGHLTLVRGVGINRTMTEEPSGDWNTAIAADELAVGHTSSRRSRNHPDVVPRTDDRQYALSNHCTPCRRTVERGRVRQLEPRRAVREVPMASERLPSRRRFGRARSGNGARAHLRRSYGRRPDRDAAPLKLSPPGSSESITIPPSGHHRRQADELFESAHPRGLRGRYDDEVDFVAGRRRSDAHGVGRTSGRRPPPATSNTFDKSSRVR